MQDSSAFFKQHLKYGKQHLMEENSYHLREMIEQCSRCSLPTGSGTSDQKSENVKSSVTPMPTNNPIFVIICFIKTPLHYEKLRTWVTPLRSHINFIVGPTGPNYYCLEWKKKWTAVCLVVCSFKVQKLRLSKPPVIKREVKFFSLAFSGVAGSVAAPIVAALLIGK